MRENIRVNRLPLLTYRYLHTNDSPCVLETSSHLATISFSDSSFVQKGGELPPDFDGASKEVVEALSQGEHFTITVPEGKKEKLTITLQMDHNSPDYLGEFVFHLGKNASLQLIWQFKGADEKGTIAVGACYDLAEQARLEASELKEGLTNTSIFDQRNANLAEKAEAHFHSAELGGQNVYIHSFARLNGEKSKVEDTAVYTGEENQHLDLFYHYIHFGKKTHSHIDVKGSLNDSSKKIFRGTIDFKSGCKGAVGDEGDYAIQLNPKTHNISLPLLLCTEDDVEGNHASSAGQLDQSTIYFLMCRGFSKEQARRIVIESLIRPLIDLMAPEIRDKTLDAVKDRLDKREA